MPTPALIRLAENRLGGVTLGLKSGKVALIFR